MTFARAIIFAVLLGAIQYEAVAASTLLNFDDLLSKVKSLQQSSEASLNATISKATSEVDAEADKVKANLSSVMEQTQAEVDKLVSDAEAQGNPGAAACGTNATVTLLKTWAEAMQSLAHCQLDYLDVFNSFEKQVAQDFADMLAAIPNGLDDWTSCSLLQVTCYWQAFHNATKVEATKSVDVTLQLVNAGTAAINLVATITNCDEEAGAQAILDMAAVVPQTAKCIKQA